MRARVLPAAVLAVAVVAGCGRAGTGEEHAAAREEANAIAAPPAAAEVPARIATMPSDPCSLVSAAEVEEIIGRTEGPPEREDGECWFYLPIDSQTPEWQQMRTLQRRLREMGATGESPPPERPGLSVAVDVAAGIADELAMGAANRVLSGWASDSGVPADAAAGGSAPAVPGWDRVGSPPGFAGFDGRIGHVRVTIRTRHLEIADETLEHLASRVRDRVPELPFADPNADTTRAAVAGPDPCGVLTRAEAEKQLGPLIAAPYRSRNGSPLVDRAGESCTYLAAKHRAIVLTPEWTGGERSLRMTRGIGDLIGSVADVRGDVQADTLAGGVWDDIAFDATTGELLFLKGDRLLHIGYGTSALGAPGAVRLADVALRRM